MLFVKEIWFVVAGVQETYRLIPYHQRNSDKRAYPFRALDLLPLRSPGSFSKMDTFAGGIHLMKNRPRYREAEIQQILFDLFEPFVTDAADDERMLSFYEHDV